VSGGAPRPRGAVSGGAPRPPRAARYTALAWRVFAINAAVLLLSGLVAVVVFSPGAISSPVATKEVAIVAGGLVVMLAVNRLLLVRELASLERVTAAMRRTDPLVPGERVAVPERPSEASDLAVAFNAMAERLEDERRDSARRVLGAQEGERLRIARELHDEVGQQLTALLLQLASARRAAGPGLEPTLGEAHALARESLEDVRRVARELRPEALDDLGLVSALAALCERLDEQAGLKVDQDLQPVLPPLAPEEELVVYRVAQEALTNVLRHAGRDKAELELRASGGELVLDVRDDGRGFDPDGVAGNGLVGMRERALLVGGRLVVRSRPGRGTMVRLALPLDSAR
jgi:two-component system, NarL family, sensor histidine kinase UhpB